MGVYDELAVKYISDFDSNKFQIIPEADLIECNPKCKCPNPKHTNGCSIEPEDDHCLWCKLGCRKRVMAVHVKYE